MIAQSTVDSHTISFCLEEGELESGEESCRARDGHANKAELAKDAFPFLATNSVGSQKFGEDLG